MNDFTKTKLINSLIDVVEKFYHDKQTQDVTHLKGFCEGIAYSLIEMGALESQEASKILKGLGKKRELPSLSIEETIFTHSAEMDSLDMPTFLRKGEKNS